MEREIRYCTTEDGVRIAYCEEGEGPPLLMCPMWVESISSHVIREWELFRTKVGRGRRVIRYDMRGTGLSDREPADVTFDGQVRDLEAVVGACGLDTLVLWGCGLSGPRTIAYAAKHPAAVTHLILFDTYASSRDVFSPETVAGVVSLIRTNWEMASQMLSDISLRETHPEAALVAVEATRRSVDPATLARLLEEGYRTVDAGPMMAQVRAKTLVLHRVDDPGFLFIGGQKIAAGIPGAQLVPLEGNESYYFLGETATSLKVIRRFLDDRPAKRAKRGSDPGLRNQVRTVLFTDLVGHTEMMSRLGDDRGRDALREHERITREVLKANGGTEVKTMGDGFMASFGSVTKAVECAIALQRAFAEHEGEPLAVRVGLNAGEPIEEDGDLFGATVILASRIAAKADGGEILVADTVRGLCSGKGFLFADRGEFVAKGFEEPVRVSEVNWRNTTAS